MVKIWSKRLILPFCWTKVVESVLKYLVNDYFGKSLKSLFFADIETGMSFTTANFPFLNKTLNLRNGKNMFFTEDEPF